MLEKTFENSFSLKRGPGILKFVHFGWNMTVPNYPPMRINFHLEESASKAYQVFNLRLD